MSRVLHRSAALDDGPHAGDPSPWIALVAQELGDRVPPAQLRAGLRAVALVLPVVIAATLHPLAGLLLAASGVAMPRVTTPELLKRRAARRDGQLAAAIERIAAAIRAGASLASALDEVAADCPAPLGPELQTVARAARHGRPLTDALDAWVASAGGSGEVALAGAALALGARAGGPVARALDGVAATLRERRQLQAEVRALATQARASAWLLAVAPLGFAALMSTVEPRAVGFLVATPVGWVCLGAGLALDVLGAVWMARLVGRVT